MNFKSIFSNPAVLALIFAALFISGCESFGGKINPGDQADLAQLAGKWIRVESNNPSNDFMRITVTGSTGTITDKSGSGFQDGDVKWRNITPSGQETFTYEELGSDYNYYEASITIISQNELRLAVASSGAGNNQKWLRDDGSIVDTTSQELECGISTETTLANTPAAIDYIVPSGCVVDITAKLTIEPGVVIAFEENAGFGVYDAGALYAVGTDQAPIVLKGAQAVSGYWRGVHIETNSINNRLEHVRIEDAGSNYVYCCNDKAALFIKDGKTVLKNSSISNSGAFGLKIGQNAEMPEYQNNTFSGNTEAPVYLPLKAARFLDGTGSSYMGNTVNFIEVYESGVNVNTTVPANDVPYLVEGKVVDVTKPLVLQAGVSVRIKENGGIGVYDEGTLKIEGTSTNPVSIKGFQSNQGYWRGIHIETNSNDNQLHHVQIADAGSEYVYCCNVKASVFLKGGKASIQNATISNGENYGIYANNDAEFSSYSNNTIETHKLQPLYIAVNRVGELDGTGSTYQNNDLNYLGIFNSNMDAQMTWPKANVPYLIEVNTVIDVTEGLTVEAGTEIQFESNAGLGVYDNGYLKAIGTASEKIKFLGLENSAGYWRGIHTETNSGNNVLKQVEIRNAGSNYVYCCNEKAGLIVKDGIMEVSNSYIADNNGCGIFVKSSATLTESGNTFANNTDGHICN
jgi:hypothetical protein